MMSKGDVNGPDTRATYEFVRSQTDIKITWNFKGKFLVSKDGVVSLTNDPMSDIAALMAEHRSDL